MRVPSPSGSTERTRPTPSTWPCTTWPPSGSPARTAGSTLTASPAASPPSALRSSVSGTASNASTPSSAATTVRQMPPIETESPTSASAAVPGASTRRRTPASPPSMAATRPRSRTMPVNTTSRLRHQVRHRAGRGGDPGAERDEHGPERRRQPVARRHDLLHEDHGGDHGHPEDAHHADGEEDEHQSRAAADAV